MLIHVDLASLIRSLISSGQEAITVAQWAPISPHIADAQYIFVSQLAAEFFGYKDVSDLEGQYLSQRYTLEDFDRDAKLATARYLGFDLVPSVYTSRIIMASGDLRMVSQHTRQFNFEGITYWITKLTPADIEHPLPDIDLSQIGATAADLWRFRRQFNIATLEQMLIARNKLLQSEYNSSNLSQKTEIRKDGPITGGVALEAQNEVAASDTIVLHPGGSAHIPPGRNGEVTRSWMHWCRVCSEIWRSDDADPSQCGRRPCRSTYWRTGVPQEIALESGRARRGRRRLH
jgi:hypothetical protein